VVGAKVAIFFTMDNG